MLKLTRWLMLSVLLVVGCDMVPVLRPPTPTAGQPAGVATTAPGGPAPTSAQPGQPAPPQPPTASPSPSPSPSPTAVPKSVVKLGTSSSLGGWIVDVADRQGFMSAMNITLDRKESDPGSAAIAEDVDKKERDVAVLATDRLVQNAKNGQALIMIAGLVNKANLTLVAARDVPDFNALKGKPIGHLDAKSASAAIVKRILEVKKLPKGEIPVIAFPDPGVVGAAVANGTVGASLVDPPRAGRLKGAGFTVLLEGLEVARDFQAEGLVVRPEWARQNEELVTRFVRAVIMAERWITNPANKKAAIDEMARSLGVNTIEATLVYEQYVERIDAIPHEGDIDQGGVRGVVELLGEVDALPDPKPEPARLADTTFVQRAKSIVGPR
ncbi:MAG: ABC transporter substrate-binding protein [Chloroflexota bacterium]